MLKTIKMAFENTEVLELPADIIDLHLTHITESAFLFHPDYGSAHESLTKKIGEGYVAIRKDWFPAIARRAIVAERTKLPDALATQTLAGPYVLAQNVKDWVAQGLTDDEIVPQLVDRLTDHFAQGTPADLTDLELIADGAPTRTLELPWLDIRTNDPYSWSDNHYAINLETADQFVVLFDGNDPHFQNRGREKAEEMGFDLI
ncbi:hypothetical protein [Schleiferilactobacillus harbinensis]|uniref:Uncharacterized protein n=1 Tax=Schleiferilactobacillus harbinensis TaxID=304207 RepID=A0ABU7T235_9LACO